MKRKVLCLSALLLLFLAVGCSKQKTCRCAVRGTSKMRIIKIERGECDQITLYQYHNEHNVVKVDSLVCTDYEFAIDSIFNE